MFIAAVALPVRPHEAALGGDRAQLEHRRVGRQDRELAAGRRQLETAIERLLEVGDDLQPSCGKPAYVNRSASSAARSPLATIRSRLLEQRLEVDVPDPGDVASVGDPVVEGDDERRGTPPSSSVRSASLAPAGFLTRSSSTPRSPDRRTARSARRRRVNALEPGDDRRRAATSERERQRRPRRARCRRCRGRAAARRTRAAPCRV